MAAKKGKSENEGLPAIGAGALGVVEGFAGDRDEFSCMHEKKNTRYFYTSCMNGVMDKNVFFYSCMNGVMNKNVFLYSCMNVVINKIFFFY